MTAVEVMWLRTPGCCQKLERTHHCQTSARSVVVFIKIISFPVCLDLVWIENKRRRRRCAFEVLVFAIAL